MKKSRYVRAIITSAIAIFLFALLVACGGGGDDGGVAGTSGTVTLEVSATSIPADGSSSVIITATVKDSAGNPVRHYTDVTFSTTLGRFMNNSTSFTMQTQPPLDANGRPDRTAPPTGVAEVALIAGTTPGSAKVTVTSNSVSQTIYVTISGPAASVKLSTDSVTIPADGRSSATITATLTDSSGAPVIPGTEVTFTTTLGTFAASTQKGNTAGTLAAGSQTYTVKTSDDTGIVKVSLVAGTTAGSALVTATSNGVTQAIYVGFGGAPVAIALIATPASIWADGESSSTITATLTDASGAPVTPGTSVTFATNLGSFLTGSQTYTVTTPDATGVVKVSLIAGLLTGSALVSATSNSVTQSVYVTFTEKGGEPFAIALTAAPDTINADGSSSSKITATLTDNLGQPVNPGTTITFTTTLGTFSNGSTTYTITTPDDTGIVSVSLISGTTAGTATVTAASGGVIQSVTVNFTGAVVASITVTAEPSTLPADGASTSEVRALVQDAQGNPVADGEEISFTITSGTGSLSAASAQTSGGYASVTYTAGTTAGSVVIQAMSENSVSGNVTITLESAGVGSITLVALPTSIPADGTSSSAITATLTDAAGNPVAKDTSVSFTTTLGTFSNGTTTYTLTTPDDTGTLTVSLIAGTTAGTATVVCSSSGVTQNVTVQFTGGAGTPASLSLGLSQTSVKSDNSDSSTITATVLDSNNAALEGIVVAFSASGGQISASSAKTNASGQATITFSSGTTDPSNRTATITATVAGLTPETIPIEITGSALTLSTDKTSIPDNGSDTATLTVTAKNAGGTAVYNTAISFAVSGTGGATITPSSGNTDVSGQLQVTVSGTSAGSVTVTATGLGTTATQAYTVTGVGTGFAIVLPITDPLSTPARTTATLVTTEDNTTIAFNDNGAAADTITSAAAFGAYFAEDKIMVGGSANNDGVYTLSSTVAPTANTLTLVSADSLTTEAAGSTVTVTNGVLVRVRAPGLITQVAFATTIGVWDGGASPLVKKNVPVSDFVWAVLTSNLAGTASVQVYDAADSSTSDGTTVAFTVPSGNAAQLTLQADVYMVAPSIGATTNTATLTATVRTSLATGSQVVSGVAVAFAILNPTGGGESISPTVVVTDSAGQAKATFTSGSLSSGAAGVTINAWVVDKGRTTSNTIAFNDNAPAADTITRTGGSFISDGFVAGDQITVEGSTSNDGSYTLAIVAATTLTLVGADSLTAEVAGDFVAITAEPTDSISIVIGGTAGSVVIGRGTTIYDADDATYRLPMSALVTDSNGNAVSGAVVTLSAWPLQYSSGVWYDSDPEPKAEYFTTYITGTFDNEDANENLILDPGEDKNGNGQLTPPSSSAGGVPVPAEVRTDANGVAQFNLYYLKASAVWIVTRVRASTFVVGTETTSSVTLRLPAERVQATTGLLPNSPYPVGLTTSTTAVKTYTFPVFSTSTGVGLTASNTQIIFNNTAPATITRADGGSFAVDGFEPGDRIRVQGSTSNNGYYTLAGVVAATLTLVATDTLTTEGAGATVTITGVSLSDTFSTTTLSIGCSSIVSSTRVYTYDPDGSGGTCTVTGVNAKVGDWVWDWVSVTAGATGSTISAIAPVRIIIQ